MTARRAHVPFDHLSALVDGELDAAHERGARAHLEECAACSAEVARLDGVDEVIGAASDPECMAALEFISGHADGELGSAGAALAETHLRTCEACRAEQGAWTALDATLRALPAVLPPTRTDAAIAALVERGLRAPRLVRTGPLALRAALAVMTAVAITLIGPFAREVEVPDGGEPAASVQAPFFASQYAVFNPRTNTLYLAQPSIGRVAALDATTRAQLASIDVGGRPTALALDQAANTILVMDASKKTVTEIDGARNTVGITIALAIEGTPTAIHVDSANGKILVSGTAPSVPTPSSLSQGATLAPPPHGFVAVLNGGTKRLESQRPVSEAPRAVVLNLAGTRALLVAADATTLVDAATYRAIDRLPGGVGAAFSATGDSIAILSEREGAARVSLTSGGDPGFADVAGRPVALIALTDGEFAVLADAGSGKGTIAVLSPDGLVTSTIEIALTGRNLIYDPAARRFSVAGESVVSAARPEAPVSVLAPAGVGSPAASASAAPQAPPGARTTAQPSASAVPGATAAPGASASPAAGVPPSGSPSVAPSQPSPSAPAANPAPPRPPAAASRLAAGLLAEAPWAWADTYRVALPDGRRPVVVGGNGARLWFVDQRGGLSSIDTSTGGVLTFAQLPPDAHVRWVVVGPTFVHLIDTAGSRIFSLDLVRERMSEFSLGSLRSVVAAAVTSDDRLWLASGEATQLVSFDPRTRVLNAVDIRSHQVTALFGDAAGRLWFAEEARKEVGYVDATGGIVAAVVPRHGRATALIADAAGVAWLGTDSGELLAMDKGSVVQ
ncbi:MAG: zf-HC2 domain-containing protein, partial [Candidatus Limnocylindria bacterium]